MLKRYAGFLTLMILSFTVGTLVLSRGLYAENNDEPATTTAKPMRANSKQMEIARLVVQIMDAAHYSGRRFSGNTEMSEQAFNLYLDTMDPNKMFLLQSEVDSYRAQYAHRLDRMIVREGDLSFPFEVNARILSRVNDYYDYSCTIADEVKVFDSDETLVIDRKEAAYPATPDEMRKLWRARTINELVILRVTARAAADEAKTDSDKAEHSSWNKTSDAERVKKRIEVLANYMKARTAEDVVELFLNAVTMTYDPHSNYMAPVTSEDFQVQMGLELIGIGAELTSEEGYVRINRIIPGGSADKCGQLKASDRIIAAAEEGEEPTDLVDMPLDKAIRHIRGKLNSKVTLTILDGALGLGSAPKKVTLLREKVELKDSEAKSKVCTVYDEKEGRDLKIGVVTLPSFYFNMSDMNAKSAFDDVRNLIVTLRDSDRIDALVMDMRSNPGGALMDAIRISSLFVDQSLPAVQVRDRRNNCQSLNDTMTPRRSTCVYEGPLVVMVNKLSASAAEIYAAAMQDHKRAIIVGDKQTHGKGTVQEVRDLDDFPFVTARPAGSLKFTNAKFYRANGASTQLRGVIPDIVFPSFTDFMEIGEDQLEHALPFDVVRPSTCGNYIKNYAALLDNLRKASDARRAKSEAFQALNKEIEFYKSLREQKTISLNENLRYEQYKREKALIDEQSKLMNVKASELSGERSDPKKTDAVPDIYLEETLQIARDLFDNVK